MKSNKLGFIIIVVLLSVTSILSLNLFFKERIARDELDIHKFPYQIGQWKGQDLEVTERDYKILETRNLISRQYVSPSNESLWLFIIYSETNRNVFHPPEMCIMGSGLEMVNKTKDEIDSGTKKISTNKLYLEKDNYKEITLYSYKAGSIYTYNFYLQQAYLALHQIFGKRVGGATIRVAAPLVKDETATLAMLKDFLKESVNTLETLR